jgi:hypothetical protein
LAILHGIEDRGLVQNILWRAYFNPVPISDELAMMIGRTNGYASITFDSASDTVLARNGKSFRRKDLQPLIDRCLARGVQPSLGFLFGLPGETEKTLEETITFIRDIPQELDVNYECGLRVYPGTPLEAMARADPIHVVEAGPEPLDIRIYCAPRRPRDLTRYLREAFADRPNVRPTGPAYRSGSRINSTAYRLVRRDDEVGDEWAALLDVCAKQRWPDDYYEAVRGIARWYGRTELDAEATRRLDLVGGLWQPNLSMNEINEQE